MKYAKCLFTDCFRDITGGNSKIKKSDYLEAGELPVIDQGKQLIGGFTSECSKAKRNGEVIIFGDHTGIVKYIDFDFALGADGVKVIEPNYEKVNTRYAYYAISTIYIPDTGYDRKFKYLKRGYVPLPPLPVQKRIADILDTADRLLQADKKLLEKYDQLSQSLFLEMFGDPVSNPKGWDTGKVIEYCNCIVPNRNKPKIFDGNIPWVTTNDLKHLEFTFESDQCFGLTENEIASSGARLIPSNSVIMTCVGDLGKVSINPHPMVVNQQLHTFQCGDKLNKTFLMFNLSKQTAYMYKMASTTTVAYMNKTVCNNIPIILPPLNLQIEFENRFIDILKLKVKVNVNKEKSHVLFQSLLQKAFKGELINESDLVQT